MANVDSPVCYVLVCIVVRVVILSCRGCTWRLYTCTGDVHIGVVDLRYRSTCYELERWARMLCTQTCSVCVVRVDQYVSIILSRSICTRHTCTSASNGW
eukprot:COSAG01_NODE_5192_length_4420_cov_38.410553_5_plen_99_part_00